VKDSNFFPQEKLFARTTKNSRKQPRTSNRSRKIRPANRSEVKIQFRKDEESAEKVKELHPLDFAQRTDSRRIREKVHFRILAFQNSGLGVARGRGVTASQSFGPRNPEGIQTVGSGARWPESRWIKAKEERSEPSDLAPRSVSRWIQERCARLKPPLSRRKWSLLTSQPVKSRNDRESSISEDRWQQILTPSNLGISEFVVWRTA
jgi:hypothetical protein